MAFLAGLTGLGSFLGDSAANKTTTSTGTTSGTQSGTSTNTQNLTPGQTALSGPLYSTLASLMTPTGAQAAVAPFTAASRDATNSTYSGLADTLRSQFLSTGNGASGKFGTALTQGNLQRLAALQGVDTTGQQEAQALPLQAMSTATGLLEHPFSSTTSGSSSSSGSSNSTTVGPHDQLAALLQGFTGSLAGQQNSLNQIIGQMLGTGG